MAEVGDAIDMKAVKTVAAILLGGFVAASAGYWFSEYRHEKQAAQAEVARAAMIARQRQAEEVRVREEAERLREKKRQQEERLQQEEAERLRQEQERLRLEEARRREALEEARSFILAKYPMSGVWPQEHERKSLFGLKTDYEYTYTHGEYQIEIEDCVLVFRSDFYEDTTNSRERGAWSNRYSYRVTLSELDPTRIAVNENASIEVHARESRNVVAFEAQSPSSRTTASKSSLNVDTCCGSEGRRKADQIAKALAQLVTACGGRPEAF